MLESTRVQVVDEGATSAIGDILEVDALYSSVVASMEVLILR